MADFSSQVIVDIDETEHGWEVVARLDADSCECAVTDVPDGELETAVTACVGAAMLAVRAERAKGQT